MSHETTPVNPEQWQWLPEDWQWLRLVPLVEDEQRFGTAAAKMKIGVTGAALAKVVGRWESLPEAVRVGILAMVKAAAHRGGSAGGAADCA